MSDTATPMFAPGSVNERILLEWVYLLGGMRALLMQVAHPGIAHPIVAHAEFGEHMWDRLRITLDLMRGFGLGSPREVQRADDILHAIHTDSEGMPLEGTAPDGTTFNAKDPVLHRWALITLVDTALEVEKRFCGELTDTDRNRYFEEFVALFPHFYVTDDLIPDSLDELLDEVADTVIDLEVSDAGRQIAAQVLRPPIRFLPGGALYPMRAITTEMLPPPLRDAFGLPLTPAKRRTAHAMYATSRAVLPRLPQRMRRVKRRPLVR